MRGSLRGTALGRTQGFGGINGAPPTSLGRGQKFQNWEKFWRWGGTVAPFSGEGAEPLARLCFHARFIRSHSLTGTQLRQSRPSQNPLPGHACPCPRPTPGAPPPTPGPLPALAGFLGGPSLFPPRPRTASTPEKSTKSPRGQRRTHGHAWSGEGNLEGPGGSHPLPGALQVGWGGFCTPKRDCGARKNGKNTQSGSGSPAEPQKSTGGAVKPKLS